MTEEYYTCVCGRSYYRPHYDDMCPRCNITITQIEERKKYGYMFTAIRVFYVFIYAISIACILTGLILPLLKISHWLFLLLPLGIAGIFIAERATSKLIKM